eukprot:gene45514-60819_t
MNPMTRCRADADGVPTPIMATYYAQRATAGLIITEATAITQQGQGYSDVPGLYGTEQLDGWKKVTDAVHAEGGRIVIQLWHVGRISHTSLLPGGAAPESSTSRPANGKTYIREGFAQVSAPRALRTEEIPAIVEQYGHAARCAIDAGFDGVEVHGANGYLIEQFLRDSINDRTDAYGGSVENRCRLLLEVMRTVCAAIGAGRTGLRLSPITPANDAGQDSDAFGLFSHAVAQLAPMGLAYLHVVEGATGGPRDLTDQGVAPFDFAALRKLFPGAWMVNNGYDGPMARQVVESGAADLVAFGRPFIANPDLAQRLRQAAPLNKPDSKTFYGGGAQGYTDYPALA